MNARTIAEQLRAAFHGIDAYEIQVGAESYEINVALSAFDRNSLWDLENFRITLTDGTQIPIGSVAILSLDRGVARIARVDGRRAVTVQGDIDTRVTNAAEIIGKLKKELIPDFSHRYPSIHLSIEGQSKEAGKTGSP